MANALTAQIRYTIRRLRRKAPKAIILVALVGDAENFNDIPNPQAELPFDFVERSLGATIARILAVANAPDGLDASYEKLTKAG